MTDHDRSPEYQQLAQRFLEMSKTQHTRSFAASCDPDTAAAVPHEFIDWALAEFRNNRWGAVEPHMVSLNNEILDLHFGDADRRAGVLPRLWPIPLACSETGVQTCRTRNWPTQ